LAPVAFRNTQAKWLIQPATRGGRSIASRGVAISGQANPHGLWSDWFSWQELSPHWLAVCMLGLETDID
jgi:hypothetical protein